MKNLSKYKLLHVIKNLCINVVDVVYLFSLAISNNTL